jgi:hypothetical protein
MSLNAVRAIADAVLYEGYLLYPYRASSAKNQSRWQFGVLGPPAAAAAAFGEAPGMTMQCLLTPGGSVTIHLRFLQLQAREVQLLGADGSYTRVDALPVGGDTLLSWDEAVEREITTRAGTIVEVPGGEGRAGSPWAGSCAAAGHCGPG